MVRYHPKLKIIYISWDTSSRMKLGCSVSLYIRIKEYQLSCTINEQTPERSYRCSIFLTAGYYCQAARNMIGEGGSIIIVLDEDGNVEITFSLCYNWVGYFYGGSISCPAPGFLLQG